MEHDGDTQVAAAAAGMPVEEGGGEEESTYFAEQADVLRRLEGFAGPDPPPPEAIAQELAWLQKVLGKYQEQSNLLDPALEGMLALAMGRARAIILAWHQPPPDAAASFPLQVFDHPQLHGLFVFVYTLCCLRGHKTVTKFFPHEAADLEPVLHALQSQDREDHRHWHTRYGLLLWLSMLVIVPFDICSIDSGLGGNNGNAAAATDTVTLVGTICDLATEYLRDPGPTREAAAVCLASLLKRPDMETHQLAKFLTWAEGILMPPEAEAEAEDGGGWGGNRCDAFLLLGVLQTLSVLLKAGHRHNLLGFLPSLLHCLARLDSRDFGGQTLNRKLKMKLLQRIGLAYLPPRVAAWRYQRGQRSLLDNLKKSKGEGAAVAAAAATPMDEGEGPLEDEEDKEEEENVPEDLEEIVEELLSGLRDRDTIVRWSAAKGLGRITDRLPQSFGDEVVASVLMSFAEGAADSAWHGGCLALAELARRGLLLPTRLGEVVPVVAKALQYDVRRGHTSVGAHVRDAACYVCWAFARAYSPQVMRPYVPQLCQGMLLTSLFDREINCRRAASAAFQENVGRQGHQNFPHGIEILTAADYFTLGNRQAAYLSISPCVARFGPYKVAIIDHLAQVKLRHWDTTIRTLASATLRRLTCLAPGHMLDEVLPSLLGQVDAVDLNRRHGAILGVAEVLLGLAQLPTYLPGETVKAVVDVVPKVEQARLYRGRGGEFVRLAACRLMECVALAGVALPVKAQLRLLDSIDENLRHPVEDVQSQAVAAMRAFALAYFGGGDAAPSARLQARVVDKYRALIDTDDNVAVTRGFVRALGALPARLLRPSLDAILGSLDGLTQPLRLVGDEPDAETRRNALWALVEMTQTLGVEGMIQAQLEKVLGLLLRATEDYATDKRGDIGSWVRMAALQGLAAVVKLVVVGSGGPHGGEEKDVPVTVGDHVTTAYGHGTVRDVRCDGQVCQVQFLPGQPGAFYFPYGPGLGLLPREACWRVPTSEIMVVIGSEDGCGETPPVAIAPVLQTSILSAVLKQLCEKLDAVRDCAGKVLLELVPLATHVPDHPALAAAFGVGTEAVVSFKGGNPAVIFPRVVQLLGLETYHPAVVSGLIISVGGLTESVVKASLGAMVDWAQGVRRHDATAALVHKVGHTMLGLFDAHAKDDRVISPLLRSVDLFFQKGVFLLEEEEVEKEGAVEDKGSFAWGLVERVKGELQGCRDVKKMLACLGVAIHLLSPLSFEPGQEDRLAGAAALRLVLILLGHRFPRVRKAAAEQLYTTFLLHDHLLERRPAAHDEALEALSSTAWDGEDLVDVRRVRDNLCALLVLAPPAAASGLSTSESMGVGRKKKAEDELASYASLVKNMGY